MLCFLSMEGENDNGNWNKTGHGKRNIHLFVSVEVSNSLFYIGKCLCSKYLSINWLLFLLLNRWMFPNWDCKWVKQQDRSGFQAKVPVLAKCPWAISRYSYIYGSTVWLTLGNSPFCHIGPYCCVPSEALRVRQSCYFCIKGSCQHRE